MRAIPFSVMLAGFLSCVMVATAGAEAAQPGANQDPQSGSNDDVQRSVMSEGAEDPENLLLEIGQRRTQKNSLFPVSPLERLHEANDRLADNLYKATHIKLALAFTHLFQWLSESPLGEDEWGTASTLDFLGTWELVDREGPTQGQLFFQLQGRWEYGTTGPERLGAVGLGAWAEPPIRSPSMCLRSS